MGRPRLHERLTRDDMVPILQEIADCLYRLENAQPGTKVWVVYNLQDALDALGRYFVQRQDATGVMDSLIQALTERQFTDEDVEP